MAEKQKASVQEGSSLDLSGPCPAGQGTALGGVTQIMICPYNENHQIGYGSFPLHLLTCRQSAPCRIRHQITVCEYNLSHHINKNVYEEHLTVCPDYKIHLEMEGTSLNDWHPAGMRPRADFVDIKKYHCYEKTESVDSPQTKSETEKETEDSSGGASESTYKSD